MVYIVIGFVKRREPIMLKSWIQNIKNLIHPKWKKRTKTLNCKNSSYQEGYKKGYWEGVEDMATVGISLKENIKNTLEV
jgi:hypothetical protein